MKLIQKQIFTIEKIQLFGLITCIGQLELIVVPLLDGFLIRMFKYFNVCFSCAFHNNMLIREVDSILLIKKANLVQSFYFLATEERIDV